MKAIASLLLTLGGIVGCALLGFGGGGDDLIHAKTYHVSPPKRWTSIDQGESDHAYRLPSGNIVTLTSSCNRNSHAPLEYLTRHLLLGERNTEFRKRERIRVDGKEGLFSDVSTTLEGKAFQLNLFVLPSHGCIFDFSLVSPGGIGESETEEFLSFVKSFRYGKS